MNSALPQRNTTTSDRLTTFFPTAFCCCSSTWCFAIYDRSCPHWVGPPFCDFLLPCTTGCRNDSRLPAAVFSTLAVTLLLIVPAILLTTLFVSEAVSISRGVHTSLMQDNAPAIAKTWAWIAQRIPGLDPNADLVDLLQQAVQKQAAYLAQRLGYRPSEHRHVHFRSVCDDFCALLFLSDADDIIAESAASFRSTRNIGDVMIVQARDLISASVTTSLIICRDSGVLGGLGFVLVGLPTPLFWGVAMRFFSLVPVVGSGLIFVPAALCWDSPDIGARPSSARDLRGCTTIVDNVLRPILLGGRTELSGLVIFISVVGASRSSECSVWCGSDSGGHGRQRPGGLHEAAGKSADDGWVTGARLMVERCPGVLE